MYHKKWIVAAVAFGIVALYADGQELQDTIAEIVVTGTGTEHLLKNAPVQTEVISGKTLENYAGKSLEDILGGLSASFDFMEDDMGSGMQMNGLGNTYILVLIDGKRIHGDNGGQNDLSVIDAARIERIEIVKGAASALYGSDAIAGVINIITKKPQSGFMVENNTRGGSYGDLRQHNAVAFTVGKLASLTNFNLKHSDGWQNTSIEAPSQTEFYIDDSRNKTVNRNTSWQIAERLSYRVTDALELYAEGNLYWKRIYRPNGRHASVDVKGYDMEYNNSAMSAGGQWRLPKGNMVTMDLDWNRHAYYYDYTLTWLVDVEGSNQPYPYFPGDRALQSDQQRTMGTLKGMFNLPYKNLLSAGLEYRYDWLKAPQRIESESVSDNTEALYLQDEFNLLQPLNITAGLRLNRNENFGWKLTPKISAMLRLGLFRLRTSWAQGFKTPTLKELHYKYIRDMNGVRLYLGNKDLKPQVSNYFSLGGEYTDRRFTVAVTGYYNKVDDMINLVTISRSEAPGEYVIKYDPVNIKQYRNIEDAKTYGVDVNLKYNVNNEISVGGGWSYLDTQANIYDTEKEEMKKATIDGMAHHKANVFATWNHQWTPSYKLGIGVYGKFSTKRYYQDYGNGKGYQIWRLTTTHDFGKSKAMEYRAEAGIDNLFNYIDRTPHGLHLGTTTPGTTVYASFIIRFSKGKQTKNKIKTNVNQRSYEEN